MLVYEAPNSPGSWLGKEDFWLIGEGTEEQIERKLSGGLFNCLLYPQIEGEVIRPAQVGLRVRSRTDVGMPRNILLAGANSTTNSARIKHMHRFEGTLEASLALIQAAGVLEVVENPELITQLTAGPSYHPVREIVPAFAASLGRCIIPQLPLE